MIQINELKTAALLYHYRYLYCYDQISKGISKNVTIDPLTANKQIGKYLIEVTLRVAKNKVTCIALHVALFFGN